MMESVLLGLLQGITEFLPVSSSGHLAIAQRFFGFTEPLLTFDVALHFATMLATLFYFREDVLRLAGEWFAGLLHRERRSGAGWTMGWAMILGTILTVVVGLPLKPLVERFSTSILAVGVALVITGILLWLASMKSYGKGAISVKTALPVGIIQGMAVIPGISRSGSTIVAGMMSGLSPNEAFRFSFFLSLPAVLGATILELKDVSSAVMPSGWMVGVLISGLSGYFALKLLHRVVTLGRWRFFSIYCFAMGLFAVFFGR